jgi:hypothetical protein
MEHLLNPGFLLDLFFYPEDGRDIFLRNVGWLSVAYTACIADDIILHTQAVRTSNPQNCICNTLLLHLSATSLFRPLSSELWCVTYGCHVVVTVWIIELCKLCLPNDQCVLKLRFCRYLPLKDCVLLLPLAVVSFEAVFNFLYFLCILSFSFLILSSILLPQTHFSLLFLLFSYIFSCQSTIF